MSERLALLLILTLVLVGCGGDEPEPEIVEVAPQEQEEDPTFKAMNDCNWEIHHALEWTIDRPRAQWDSAIREIMNHFGTQSPEWDIYFSVVTGYLRSTQTIGHDAAFDNALRDIGEGCEEVYG